jgi:para-aminobenzoate synthetase component 1
MTTPSAPSDGRARTQRLEWVTAGEPMAYFGGMLATGLEQVVDLTHERNVLDRGGWWAVVATFEGAVTGYRFAHVRRSAPPSTRGGGAWRGPDRGSWVSSADRAEYLRGVRAIRERIAAGDVYQVNLCRMLSAPMPENADPLALAAVLARGNPAPYQGVLHTGQEWLVTASPELFLARSGQEWTSSPVKGTTTPGHPFLAKDGPENIMITDLVRNDLGRVAVPGSVVVTRLLDREEHPGVSHLVSTVRAIAVPEAGWNAVLDAMFPPGSVSGAPKTAALQIIRDLETVPRGPYCGAIGFVDAGDRSAVLAVGIRTFFTSTTPATVGSAAQRQLHFGTGAGITYDSDPDEEWRETELKAARLIGLASGPTA